MSIRFFKLKSRVLPNKEWQFLADSSISKSHHAKGSKTAHSRYSKGAFLDVTTNSSRPIAVLESIGSAPFVELPIFKKRSDGC